MWSPPVGVVGAGAAAPPADSVFHHPTRPGGSANASGANETIADVASASAAPLDATRTRVPALIGGPSEAAGLAPGSCLPPARRPSSWTLTGGASHRHVHRA